MPTGLPLTVVFLGRKSTVQGRAGMGHRLRTVVWRELPYSARRSLIGLLRAIDDFENFWRHVWRSLHFSPAWLFVAIVGGIGIVLTILLFCLLTQELLAGPATSGLRRPIIESVSLVVTSTDEIDSRLCLVPSPLRSLPYAAEFDLPDGVLLADDESPVVIPVEERRPVRRPPSRRPSQAAVEPPDFPAWDAVEPAVPAADPELQVDVQLWRQPLGPRVPPGMEHVLTAQSEPQKSTTPSRRTTLESEDLERWTWFRNQQPAPAAPVAYAGEPTVVMETSEESLWDDFSAWPGRTDVALHVELYAPMRANVQQPGRSRLLIRNAGSDVIRRIEVQEPLRPLDLVTHAEPAAALTDGTLYREFRRLRAGRDKTVALEWFPQFAGDRHHEARVLAEAFVAASVEVARASEPVVAEPAVEFTPEVEPEPEFDPPPQPASRESVEANPFEPEPAPPKPEPAPAPVVEPLPAEPAPAEPGPIIRKPPRRKVTLPPVESVPEPMVTPPPAAAEQPATVAPALACQVTGGEQVAVNGTTDVAIQIANTGETALTGVRIWAELPENLQHRHGNQLELVVGDLSPGETHRAILRVVGHKVGLANAKIQAVALETRSAGTQATLSVIESPPPTLVRPAPNRRPCSCPCGQQVTWRAPY